MKRILVVTTINHQNHRGISCLINDANNQNYELLLIGDKKTSNDLKNIHAPRVHFFDLESQIKSRFLSGSALPVNHYARKNFGYLVAAAMGCDWISESDDDNRLFESFWDDQIPNKTIRNSGSSQWINIYKPFGYKEYWHRGIPINEVPNANKLDIESIDSVPEIGCIQGLADGDPDIDAICRILFNPETKFSSLDSFIVEPGNYSPTNSQLTRWKTEKTLPLLYLPSTVPWRVSDIWRGLIAQRYFAIAGLTTQFRGGLGFQDRNEHNLLTNFVDELDVHMRTHLLLELLNKCENIDKDAFMRSVYLGMLDQGLVLEDEIYRLNAWLSDASAILRKD